VLRAAVTHWSCAFLDRDGTLNVKAPEGQYVARPEDLTLLTGTAEAVRRLNEAGVFVVVVTNQRGVARGAMALTDVESTHAELERQLAQAGAAVDAIYFCPHALGCTCRKPLPGLIHRAVADNPDIDLDRSVVIGDGDCDVELGQHLNLMTVRVGGPPDTTSVVADCTTSTLGEAVECLLGLPGWPGCRPR
jgi:D-glycero-D-manno-heptose 1,7-bisphosphate phosphatase